MEEKQKAYEDIIYIINQIEKVHPSPYFHTSKEKIMEKLNAFMKDDTINTKPQFLYFINQIMRELNDPHTFIDNTSTIIPFKFRMIDDKVFVINANSEYKKLIGSELKSINNVDIKKVVKELGSIVSFTTPEWVNSEVERNLNDLGYLYILPSMKGNENYTFKIGEENYNFHINQKINYDGLKEPNYKFNIDKENNIINITYRKCRNDENYPFKNFIADIEKESKENNINDFIVDLRGNVGGDSEIIIPLLRFLENKNIVTIVDNSVFSSGSLALYDLKKIGSKTVGTNIGTTMNNFGDCYNYETPNLKIKGFVSQKYVYIDDKKQLNFIKGKEQFQEFFSKKENKKYFIPKTLKPDIYVSYKENDIHGTNMKKVAIEEIKKKRITKKETNLKKHIKEKIKKNIQNKNTNTITPQEQGGRSK